MTAEPVISDVQLDDTARSWRLSPAVLLLAAAVATAAPLRLV